MMRKFLIIVSFIIFSISCGKEELPPVLGVEVDSGTALPINNLVISRSCSQGNVQISSGGSYGQTVLQGGEAVRIEGNITEPDSCFKQPLSFSCDATVTIGINRTFSCNQGEVNAGFGSSLGGTGPVIGLPLGPIGSIGEIISPTPDPISPSEGAYPATSSSIRCTTCDSPLPSYSQSYATSSKLISGEVHIHSNGTQVSIFLSYGNPRTAGFTCYHSLSCSESE